MCLALLERKVANARKDFTNVILQKRDWETEDSINKLFEGTNGIDLKYQLTDLKKR